VTEEDNENMAKKARTPLPCTTLTTEKDAEFDRHQDITSMAGNAVLAGAGDFMNGTLRYVTNIMMTHMVSPAIYGIYGELYTAMIMLGWLANLGFDGVLVRLLPSYRVKNRQDLAGGLIHFTLWITLFSGLLVGGLVFTFASTITRLFYHDPSYQRPLQEMAFLIPVIALQLVISAGLQACKKIRWKVYVDRISQPTITLISLVILYLLGLRMEALSFSTIGGYFCSVLIGQTILSKILKRGNQYLRPGYTPQVWLYTAVPFLFNELIFSIINSADVLFLSLFATSVQAAIYLAADRVNSLVAMPLNALNMIFTPMIVEYNASKQHEQLAGMLKLVTKWSLSLSLPVCLAGFVFHDAILGIFGPQYRAGGLALIILCIGNVVNAGTGPVLQVLAAIGHLRIVSLNSIITIGMNILLSLILVPRFNIIGAALAVTLTAVILNGICLVEVYKIMKIHPYRWDMYKPLVAGCAALITGFALLHFIHPGSGRLAAVENLALLIPFALVYCLIMALLRFSKEDQVVIDAILAKIKITKLVAEPRGIEKF
jgi:O-antigen/teichoic acid export membrane protein